MERYIPDGWTGPTITSEPQSWTGNWNEYPDITVTAEGEGLTYKWYFRAAGTTAWSLSSDTDNSYDSYPLTAARDGREVYCVVTDRYDFTVTTGIVTMSKAD